jgi:hypothetical protein
MADLTLKKADTLRVVESREQMTGVAGVDIDAGELMRYVNATGRFELADASAAPSADAKYMATRTVKAGMALTGLRKGIVDGFDLDDYTFEDVFYLSDNAGQISDAAGTVSKVVAEVHPIFGQLMGQTASKTLRVDL